MAKITLNVINDVNVDVTVDETSSLQNFSTVGALTQATDVDDEDIDAALVLNTTPDADALPDLFENRLATLLAGDPSPVQVAVSGLSSTNPTGAAMFTVDGVYTDLAFTDGSGNALDGGPSGLFALDGSAIFLYTDTTNSDTNNIVVGRKGQLNTLTPDPNDYIADPTGTIVLAAYLQEVSGGGVKVWTVLRQPLNHPVATNADDSVDLDDYLFVTAQGQLDFNFSGLPSGQNEFLMFKATGSDDIGLIVTGKDPDKLVNGKLAGDTVNTSQGGGPTTIGTNNQSIDPPKGNAPGEAMIFTFVKDPNPEYTVPDLIHDEANTEAFIDYGSLHGAPGGTIDIAQQTPPKAATATISAYTTAFEPKTEYYEGLLDGDDVLAYISSVTIRDASGAIVDGFGGITADKTLGGLSVDFTEVSPNARTVTIGGFKTGYSIEYTTSALHNRVMVENVGGPNGSSPFDIGGFHLPGSEPVTQEVGDLMGFEDDGPTAAIQSTSVTVTVDESAGLQTASDGVTATTTEDDNDNEVAGTTTFDKEGDGNPVTLADLFGSVAVAGGTDLDPTQYALNAEVVTSTGSGGGADGEKSKVYSLAIAGGLDGTDSHLDTTDGKSIYLYKVGDLIVGKYDSDGNGINDTAAFAIAIDQDGRVATAQFVSLAHPTSGSPSVANHDEGINLDYLDNQGNLVNLVNAVLTVTDGDDDTATDSVGIGDKIRFEDDGPTASGTAVTDTVDEDGLTGGIPGTLANGDFDVPNDDVTSNPPSGDNNEATTTGNIAGIFSPGADEPLTYGFSNNTSGVAVVNSASAVVALASKGETVQYDVQGDILWGYVGAGTEYVADDDRAVFKFELTNTSTGAYKFELLDQLDHPDTVGGDNTENDLKLQLGTILQATDKDGDTVTAAADKLVITVDDDTPVVTAKSNLVYANASNGLLGGTGVFAYAIGADERGPLYSKTNTDLSVTLTGGTVGAKAITTTLNSVTWASEDVDKAEFDVSFTYESNPTTHATTNATGTLTFDKVADTYTLKLDQEIKSFSILNTSTPGNPLQGYALGSTTTVGSNPPVSVMTLASDFFVQFEGFGLNNGTPETFAYNSSTGLFSNDRRYVTISSDSIGAASDTLQSDEVIDLDFFKANPHGDINFAQKTSRDAIFIEFTQAGPGAGKDMVVVLKLVDENNPSDAINRAFIVGNSTGNDDVINAAVPAYGFVPKAQNGIVIFESNDYNFARPDGSIEHYSIRGAQVVTSTQGAVGTGYQLNGAIDDPTTQASEGATPGGLNDKINFGGETKENNNEPIKIVNIGFVGSTTPDAHLTFDVVVTDADGDKTAQQTLDVSIVGGNGSTATPLVADTLVINDLASGNLLNMVMHQIEGGFASGTDKLDMVEPGSAGFVDGGSAADLKSFITAADGALNGSIDFYAADVGADTYLAFDADGDGITSIVHLVGVTNIASTDIV